mmetsp:Transcript_27061/g.59042  ORF Transcript_27061/g.59042 Transcript_27061/m.59042 type:complete len:249 (+) Transcript_27061:49-795(+)
MFIAKSDENPWKRSSLERKRMSIQATSVSQSGAGLRRSTLVADPPASRKRHSALSTLPSLCRILMLRRKANTSLCRSNRERHTCEYSENVKCSVSVPVRSSTLQARLEVSMEASYRLMNQARLYWYMGSTMLRSLMQKNSTAAWMATLRYTSRVVSISASVCSLSVTFLWISMAVALEAARVSMSSSSSNMLPVAVDIRNRMRSSISFSSAFIRADCAVSMCFISLSSGRSMATTMPSSWSVRPSIVT